MAYNIPKLDLDITGTNPDNRIVDEPHTLTGTGNRAISVNYGPFFAESVIVRSSGDVLERGKDYQIVELHQEATMKYGKEISSVILIINPQIPPQVTVTYQALGGHYAYSDYAIANLYQSVINDNRPVAWENIFNKPDAYPPTLHRHLLEDLYGFEPVVDILERIRNVLTIGQASFLAELMKLLTEVKCEEAGMALPNNRLVAKDHMLHFMTMKYMLSDIRVYDVFCSSFRGEYINVKIEKLPSAPDIVYWELYDPYNLTIDFAISKGSIDLRKSNNIRLYIPTNVKTNTLYLGIKYNPSDVDFAAVTYKLRLVDPNIATTIDPILLSDYDGADKMDFSNLELYTDVDQEKILDYL